MKKILLFVAICALFASCRKDGMSHMYFLHSYVPYYADVELGKPRWLHEPGYRTTIALPLRTKELYFAPETGRDPETAERFLEIAERNNDRTYDREDNWLRFNTRICSTDDFTDIRIVCPDKAWDADHPAGSSLDDLVTVKFSAFGEYVRNGYTGEDIKTYEILLSEVTAADLHMLMIPDSFSFFPSNLPASGSYDVVITITTASGEEKVATCTLDFD